MTASVGFLFDFILLLISYLRSNFDQVCGIIHGLIRACVSNSAAFNVAVPFNVCYFYEVDILTVNTS